ncbi:hypothetical protein ACFPZ0_21740 [Streptomonospora nanhaiensis]|uniref:F0F1-type ATP synthase assembly protein I n=1 Tax=Streptomonospora nanhaiensis TaxID=1323731 RepID=A0A853BK69_9ACTN|nr:hypothetical protein [Streptomonospora nanhaiensis]MBV2365310.1 hypothetical protein [Streptomonospora nanhaiensis]MBX9390638.1 hypothetical protein [Streptomonospora nanhaiensis]NYI95879.1 F0F1-type ATP synthase assembly protein I [Streptomonospora nanhaiensis]
MNDRPAPGEAPKSPEADGMTVFSYLLAGPLVFGGAGWLADWLLGLPTVFLPIGVLLGMAGAIYLIVVPYVRS